MFLVNSCLPQLRNGSHVRFHLCSFHLNWSYIPRTTRSCTFAYSMSWRCWVWCPTTLHHDIRSLAFVHPSSMQLFLLVLHWVAGLSFNKKKSKPLFRFSSFPWRVFDWCVLTCFSWLFLLSNEGRSQTASVHLKYSFMPRLLFCRKLITFCKNWNVIYLINIVLRLIPQFLVVDAGPNFY